MKKSILVCLIVIGLAGSSLVSAQAADWTTSSERRFGAGVILGEPTGISLKYWLDHKSAIDAVVGWSFESSRDNVYLHANYLYHLFDLIDARGRDRLAVYFGGGVRHQFMDARSDRFGFRGVGGVAYHLSNIPVDVFLEGGPILDVTPDTKVRFGIGIGARYWF
jgi:hypothetical protein